jgi:hypothetical protein
MKVRDDHPNHAAWPENPEAFTQKSLGIREVKMLENVGAVDDGNGVFLEW